MEAIREDDIIALIQQGHALADVGETVGEMAARTGRSEGWIRRKIRPLVISGRIEVVPRQVLRCDLLWTTTHAYTVRKETENERSEPSG